MQMTFHRGPALVAVSEAQEIFVVVSRLELADEQTESITFTGNRVEDALDRRTYLGFERVYRARNDIMILRLDEKVCSYAEMLAGVEVRAMRLDPLPLLPLHVCDGFTLALCADPSLVIRDVLDTMEP